ncbi:serine/threonine-protein kinase B-raf-like [Lingula anatina]|uniref:Serine/threonine-protein kinase B-raf-like n=1 Tax=Lingula anatina TaxID=7574 RepID=A0A1S3KBH6_LINAN|nr:serine/threonine-protein kinase B-raf-like [Lingula anatina]|eukprot:XP_013419985.1 serine/threonine-protein kinase B-raf-like [Lingula anatina]
MDLAHETSVLLSLNDLSCVPKVYGQVVGGSRPGLVMSAVPGTTLEKFLEKWTTDSCFHRCVTRVDFLHICLQVVRAIKSLHCSNILHNDLKTDNLMVQILSQNHHMFRVFVIDFGNATQVGQYNAYHIDPDDVREGRVTWLAPEVRRGEPTSISSDIYSVGVVLRDVQHSTGLYDDLDNLVEGCTREEPVCRTPLGEAEKRLLLRYKSLRG